MRFLGCIIGEEGDDDVAGDKGDREGYTIAGGRPLKGRGVSILPEPVMEEGWLGQTWIERRELDINVCAKVRLHGLGGRTKLTKKLN